MFKQLGEYDCLLACIASLLKTPIKDIYPVHFRDELESRRGAHDDDVDKAFNTAGLYRDQNYWSTYLTPQHAISPQVKGLLVGRPAILQVRSLNYEHGSHMVYWDGTNIFDPSNKQTYQWMHQVAPEYVFIFNLRSEEK